MRLRYWAKLVRMGDERIAKIIYKTSRLRLEQEEEAMLPLTKTWCKYTRELLNELHLGEVWKTEAVGTGGIGISWSESEYMRENRLNGEHSVCLDQSSEPIARSKKI